MLVSSVTPWRSEERGLQRSGLFVNLFEKVRTASHLTRLNVLKKSMFVRFVRPFVFAFVLRQLHSSYHDSIVCRVREGNETERREDIAASFSFIVLRPSYVLCPD